MGIVSLFTFPTPRFYSYYNLIDGHSGKQNQRQWDLLTGSEHFHTAAMFIQAQSVSLRVLLTSDKFIFLPLVTDVVEGMGTTVLAAVTAVAADTLLVDSDCITEGQQEKNKNDVLHTSRYSSQLVLHPCFRWIVLLTLDSKLYCMCNMKAWEQLKPTTCFLPGCV